MTNNMMTAITIQLPPERFEKRARIKKVGTTMRKWMTPSTTRSKEPPKYAAAAPTTAEITVVPVETISAMINERCRP